MQETGMVKFDSTNEEMVLIGRIATRAVRKKYYKENIDCLMDLDAVNSNDVKLDFDKLLKFDEYNFAHDICGIRNCIDRKTGKLTKCFLPKCSI